MYNHTPRYEGTSVMDFTSMDNAALTAALTEARAKATALFALTEATIEQADEAEALVASITAIEGEQATRAAAVKDAADRFAAARTTFSAEAEVEEVETEEVEAAVETEEVETEEVAAAVEEEVEEVVTASATDHTKTQTFNAAKAVARKVKRPTVAATKPVVITAAADVPNYSMGSDLGDMDTVAKAVMNRVKGFAPYNSRAAAAVRSQSAGQPVLSKFAVASFGLGFEDSLVATKGNDYSAVKAAVKGRQGIDGAMTAAGWCAPSETVYSYIADYVVDGLSETPEVSAPRGGLFLTTGPARSSQGAALDEFGFVQTETQAEAGEVKPCETIVCPEFEDFRLDAVGYCFKIPFLTQKAYPELITDALKFAGVLYAHKVNARIISDKVNLSDAVTFGGYGATFTDALEALSLIAMAERRRWNVGRNAVMTVEAPELALEVYRADISRRNGIAKDSVSDGDIARHFADRRLDVQYVSDWQEVSVESGSLVLPGEFDVMMYPAGTFIKAVEDVINLSAVYDAASNSINEYTGVFFEQGLLVAKAGYGSSLVTIPINTAGEQGALTLTGAGDASANGSF